MHSVTVVSFPLPACQLDSCRDSVCVCPGESGSDPRRDERGASDLGGAAARIAGSLPPFPGPAVRPRRAAFASEPIEEQ